MRASDRPNYRVVVIGVSAGGGEALDSLLPGLPAEFPVPIVVVRHLHPQSDGLPAGHLAAQCVLSIKQAEEKERLRPGRVYFAPPNYHLLFEEDGTLELSLDPPVHYARPSVDVTLESAVEAYGAAVVGVILTGANGDGAAGLAQVKGAGGHAVVQDPAEAAHTAMPQAALAACTPDRILPVGQIAAHLIGLCFAEGREAAAEEASP